MSVAALFDECLTRTAYEVGPLGSKKPRFDTFWASSEATLPVQEAPRACRANSGLLAITRLARPNRLKSWAWFLARPL